LVDVLGSVIEWPLGQTSADTDTSEAPAAALDETQHSSPSVAENAGVVWPTNWWLL
jgi:hypothetical protein